MTLRSTFSTLGTLSLLALGSVSLAACTAVVEPPQDPAANVCGGAVCFEPQQVAVRHWGAGEITVAAWRGEGDACKAPQIAAPQGGVAPAPGSMIEVRLASPKPGARLPIVSRRKVLDDQKEYAVVRAVRVDARGHAVADEEAVSGTATVLDVDSQSGRVRVRVRAHWSSGVDGELLLDVDGPKTCTAG